MYYNNIRVLGVLIMDENRDHVLQIKVTKTEQAFLERFLLRRSFIDAKRHSMSGFLSRSLMEKMKEE